MHLIQNCKCKLEISLKSYTWSLKFIQFFILPTVYFNMKMILSPLNLQIKPTALRRCIRGTHSPVSYDQEFEWSGIQKLHAFRATTGWRSGCHGYHRDSKHRSQALGDRGAAEDPSSEDYGQRHCQAPFKITLGKRIISGNTHTKVSWVANILGVLVIVCISSTGLGYHNKIDTNIQWLNTIKM